MGNASCLATRSQDAEKEEGKSLRSTAHWDRELQSHHDLVQALYNGLDISSNVGKQQRALDQLGLSYKDAGWRMPNEKGDELLNACFWLSLAASQLSGAQALAVWDSSNDCSLNLEDRDLLLGIDVELIERTALTLKRLVEASVLSFHPEWQDRVGESVQAFSDFLVYCLQSQSVVSEWAVVVVDACSGFVDLYKGSKFDEQVGSARRRNTITIRYIPGHYQPLLPQGPRPTLQDILQTFEDVGVVYVVTDG